jgi:cyclophilin family peptidyl-prolyl cis-trans isomerase
MVRLKYLVLCLPFLLGGCGGTEGFLPFISAAKPESLQYGRTATILLGGRHLRSFLVVESPGCANPVFSQSSTTELLVLNCTVNVVGDLPLSVKDPEGKLVFATTLTVPKPQVSLVTSAGNLLLELDPAKAPVSVNNFLSYVRQGFYTNTLFHRVISGFVVQGGGYKVFEAPNVFESITRQAAITNEPGISNLAGTVAMAKLGDDPNSATSEFFFSLGNNSSNLDNQNGGFSVFGRVSDASRTVLTTLGSVPTSSYAVKLRTNGTTPAATNFSFTDIPINQTPVPAAIDQSLLVKINSVTPVAVLSYAITTHPDSAVATAVLNGTDLEITSVGPGNTSLVVSATDVDGNSTPQTININVSKLPATITLENLTQTYDGTARVVTAATIAHTLSSGSAVTLDKPTALYILTDSTLELPRRAGRSQAGFGFDIVEVFA